MISLPPLPSLAALVKWLGQQFKRTFLGFAFFLLLSAGQAQEMPDDFAIPMTPAVGPRATRQMTLQEVLDLGLRQNPSLRVAAERVEQAQAVYEQKRSIKSPKLVLQNLTAIQPRRYISTDGLLARQFPSFPDRFVVVDPVTDQFSLSYQKLLTSFGKVEHAIAAAFLQIDVESASASLQQQTTVLDIKEAFFQKLKADAEVEAMRSGLLVSRQNLSDTRALLDRGILARYDLLQAEIEVTRAVEGLGQSFTRVEEASAALQQVLSEREYRIEPLAPDPVEFDREISFAQLEEFALVHRPEMQVLSYQRAVAERLLDAARSESKPELILAANYQTAFGQSLAPRDVPSLTLQLQWEIFDGGLRSAKIKEAESVLRELDATRELLADRIRLEIEKRWLVLLQTEISVGTALQQVENAKEYYEMASRRYRHGLSTTLEVSDALSNLIQSRTQLVEARFERDLAFARLERALGDTVPERRLTTDFLSAHTRRLTDEEN